MDIVHANASKNFVQVDPTEEIEEEEIKEEEIEEDVLEKIQNITLGSEWTETSKYKNYEYLECSKARLG
eukprot:gene12716-6914_t